MALVLNVSLRFKKGPEISFILVRTMQIGPGMIQQVQGQVWLQVKNRRLTLLANPGKLIHTFLQNFSFPNGDSVFTIFRS